MNLDVLLIALAQAAVPYVFLLALYYVFIAYPIIALRRRAARRRMAQRLAAI